MHLVRAPLSLRWILGFTFGAMVLLLVALLMVMVDQIVTGHLQATAQQALRTLTAEMTDELDRGMFERFSEIKLLAATQPLLRDPQATAEERRELLEAVQRTFPAYTWIGLIDPQGIVQVATDQLLEGQNVSERPWFQAGRATPYVGDVREAQLLAPLLPRPSNGEPLRFVDFVAPIQTGDGTIVGVLGAHLDWAFIDELEETLFTMHGQEGSVEIYILDPQNIVLAGPAGTIGKPFPWQVTHNHPADNREAHVEVPLDGQPYLLGYSVTQGHGDYTGLGWQVVAVQSLNVAYARTRQVQQALLWLGGGLALGFSLLGWWLAGRTTHQLLTIAEAADRIRQGEPEVMLPLFTGSIEVKKLSTSLNQLVADLTTATAAERNRIARELHDSVTQTLFSASMLADVLPKVWEMNPRRGMDKLSELRQSVRGALAEMRALLLELRPDAILEADMERLVRQLAEAATGRGGMQVEWEVDDNCDFSAEVKIACYRTIQEALNNIVKHAEASQVLIRLASHGPVNTLLIRDDGLGFDPEQVTSDHFGLRNMRERVEAVGGKFHLHSIPGGGAEIKVIW